MMLWRLAKARYADTAFSGEGARIAGGRWNRPGTPVVYASESRALALLEVLAGDDQEVILASDHVVFSVVCPEEHLEVLRDVPSGWDDPGWLVQTQELGTVWREEERSVVLGVPSVIVPGEFNYLINPEHPRFAELVIGAPQAFPIDERLL